MLNHFAVLRNDAVDESRVVNRAAISQSGGDDGHLKRGGKDIALANGGVCGEAIRPARAGIDIVQPLGAGKDARGFAGDGNAGFLAEAEHVADGDDLLDAGGVAELVEVGVAGNLDGVLEREFAVSAFFFRDPAAHVFIAVLNTAVAGEGFVLEARAHAGEGDGNFVGGARRVGADGAVDHGIGFFLVDLVPIRGGDRGDENIRIVGRHRGHGEDVAIARIEDHGGTAADDAQGLLGDRLDFCIESEVDIIPLDGFAPAAFALDHALGVAAKNAGAGLALEVLVHGKLDLGLSFHIGLVKVERAQVGKFIEVARGPDISEDVGGHGAVNIPADGLDADIHTREAEVFFRKEGHLIEVQVLAVIVGNFPIGAVVDLKGIGAVILGDANFLESGDDGFGNNFDDIGLFEIAGHVVDFATVAHHRNGPLGFLVSADHVGEVEIHFEAGAVFDEFDPVAIEDFAADGGESDSHLRAAADAGGVFGPFENLDFPKPPSDGTHRDQHQQGKEKDAGSGAGSLHLLMVLALREPSGSKRSM